MKARHFLYVIATVALVFGVYQGYVDAGHVRENGTLMLAENFVIAALLFGWCRAHAAERGVDAPRGAALFVAIFFPLGLPYYAFRSQPWRPALKLVGQGFGLALVLMLLFAVVAVAVNTALTSRDRREVIRAHAVPHPFPPQKPVDGHPIVGTWIWKIEERHCTERYGFAVDGSTTAVSGEEQASGVFEVSAQPDANGYYALRSTVADSNGKVGCSGPATLPGTVMNHFARFSPDRRALFFCFDPIGKSCMGPLLREGG